MFYYIHLVIQHYFQIFRNFVHDYASITQHHLNCYPMFHHKFKFIANLIINLDKIFIVKIGHKKSKIRKLSNKHYYGP